MSVAEKVRKLLEKEKIGYQVLEHRPAFTALETAQAQHLPGHQLIKCVIVEADNKPVMCVLPSTHKIDFEKLKKLLQAKEVVLAAEEIVAGLYPGMEIGAMPPFGQLAGLKVYVEKSLEENEAVAFNAGTHTDLLKIKFKDFMHLEKPILAQFGKHI